MKQKVIVSLVVAVAENGVIGQGGEMPWQQSQDLKLFRKLTMGRPVIMGRKTYQSIGRPLDGRANIVVTRDPSFAPDGVTVSDSVDGALAAAGEAAAAQGVLEIMVIGGAEIYRQLLDHADRIYLTRVHAEPIGDTWFPDLVAGDWREVAQQALEQGARDQYPATHYTYERV